MGSTPPRVRPPLLPHAANPAAHGRSLNGEYSDGDGTTRTDARASASRATAERHLHRGQYGHRKWEPRSAHEGWHNSGEGESEWGGRFHGSIPPPPGRACPTTYLRAQLPSPPRPLVLIHARAVMSVSNGSRYVVHCRVPLNPLPTLWTTSILDRFPRYRYRCWPDPSPCYLQLFLRLSCVCTVFDEFNLAFCK
jgi:hypothetical protein